MTSDNDGLSDILANAWKSGDLSLRFNERTSNPAVVFSRPPSGLIGGFSAPQDCAAGETQYGIGESGPAAQLRDVAPARAKSVVAPLSSMISTAADLFSSPTERPSGSTGPPT